MSGVQYDAYVFNLRKEMFEDIIFRDMIWIKDDVDLTEWSIVILGWIAYGLQCIINEGEIKKKNRQCNLLKKELCVLWDDLIWEEEAMINEGVLKDDNWKYKDDEWDKKEN